MAHYLINVYLFASLKSEILDIGKSCVFVKSAYRILTAVTFKSIILENDMDVIFFHWCKFQKDWIMLR